MDTPPQGPNPSPSTSQPIPSTPAPVATPPAVTVSGQAAPAPQPTPVPAKTPEEILKEKKALKEKKKKRKLLFLLIAMVGFVFVAVLLMVFFILSQSGSGSNPLLSLFGISEEQLYPFLINLTSMIFGLFDFIGFVLAIIGIFMIGMAKKDDKPRRTKGIGLLIAGLLFFMMFSVIWASSYFYLKNKKDQYTVNTGTSSYITTDPESTSNLTAPATVEFDATGLPVDENKYTIISYLWDFGDGSTGTGPTVSHRYTTKGEEGGRYVVELTVTYRDNQTSEEASEVFTVDVVFANEKVNATFTASPESGSAPLDVTFDASESTDPDGEIVQYEWDLDGDGSYDDGDEVTVKYTYTQYGTYEAKLRVTDNNGETNTMTLDIVVDEGLQPNGTIEVELEEDGEAYAGQSYYFDVTDASSPNGDIDQYEWDFGDGSTPTKNKTAKHTFDDPGTYTVTLTLTDEEGEVGTESLEITVVTAESAPEPVINTDQTWSDEGQSEITGTVPFTVIFSSEGTTDSDNNIINTEWDFDGDGTIDEVGEEAEHTYEDTGTYTATLYVQDSAGNEVSAEITVVVESQGLTAELTASTLTGEMPLPVTFDASGSSYPEGEIVNYFWDFGNGTTRYDSAQISNTFTTVGTFEVTVTAIASDGSEATDSLFINVLPVSLAACFEPNVHSGVGPLSVTFNPGCSEGSVQDYRWDFGDGDISYARKPTHEFQEAGTYTVTLTVTDSEGVTDTYSVAIAVYSE